MDPEEVRRFQILAAVAHPVALVRGQDVAAAINELAEDLKARLADDHHRGQQQRPPHPGLG